jgi:putative SOS response-associated peptidase YedK
MPARIVVSATGTEIAELFGLARDAHTPQPVLKPRYNIAPPASIPVVRVQEGARKLAELRWGLIPHWNTDPNLKAHVNARSETVAQKPSFRNAFRSRRCLVPANGFYGWKLGATKKQPYYFRPTSGGVFVCAAIWDRWDGPNGLVETVAVLTMPANDLVRPMDERMPVIVGEGHFAAWLGPNETDAAKLLAGLTPYPNERMERWPVSTRVNSPAEDDPDLLTPISESL